MSELGLSLAALLYLGLLALVATAAERGFIPRRFTRHPVIYGLSLSIFESTWSYYGYVGLARTEGYRMLATPFGATLACLLIPVVWLPVLRLTRRYGLPSLADLFSFRYDSPALGAAVTALMLAGSLPYVAQQIQGVTESLRQITGAGDPHALGAVFCVALTVFTGFFGHRHTATGKRHEGLAIAIALEAAVKITALLVAGGIGLTLVFHGPSGLSHWLAANPSKTAELMDPIQTGKWNSTLFMAMTAIFLLPRTYHMLFAEAPEDGERALATAAWILPVGRILLALPLPIILWAGSELSPKGNPDFYVLRIAEAAASPALTTFVFLGGVSAASAMVIVTTLAVGTMSLNHLLLPVLNKRKHAPFPPSSARNLYSVVEQWRRAVTAAVILAAYGLFWVLARAHGRLVDFGGNAAFVSVAQFVPGLVGVLFWKRATARGILWGLGAGTAAWFCFSVLPLFVRSGHLPASLDLAVLLGIPKGDRLPFEFCFSLALNGLVAAAVSLARSPTRSEEDASRACAEMIDPPPRAAVQATSPGEIVATLEAVIGPVAKSEVGRALTELGLDWSEARPIELSRVRYRLERNLTPVVGPGMARDLVAQGVRLKGVRVTLPDHLKDLEEQLATWRAQVGGVTAERDKAWGLFNDLLEQLRIGACALDTERRIWTWNEAFRELTGLERCGGAVPLDGAPAPWGQVLSEFALAPESERERVPVPTPTGTLVVNLGKRQPHPGEWLLVVEDITEHPGVEEALEHQARLGTTLVAHSAAMKQVLDKIARIAPSHAPIVLITGESGTGKELVARAIHDGSARASCCFHTVNCAAIAPSLLDSELFGHERGAFTDATEARSGPFQTANGGTLFLDEIGELSLEAQARLLRLLEDGQLRRVGSDKDRKVDVRVVAATHCNLKRMVSSGHFRQDLYQRLKGIEIHLRPLRERPEDLEPLAERMLGNVRARYRRGPTGFTRAALEALRKYPWPGNVRELKTVIENAVLMSDGPKITPRLLALRPESRDSSSEIRGPFDSLDEHFCMVVRSMDGYYTEEQIARTLGMHPRTLSERREKFGLPRRRR